jgi:hypothetical protein
VNLATKNMISFEELSNTFNTKEESKRKMKILIESYIEGKNEMRDPKMKPFTIKDLPSKYRKLLE